MWSVNKEHFHRLVIFASRKKDYVFLPIFLVIEQPITRQLVYRIISQSTSDTYDCPR